MTNHLCNVWRMPDEGIWEVRGGAKQFVHSKVMAWVAVDRAIQMAEQGRGKGAKGVANDDDVKRWKKVRATIHREVCAKGFDKKLNSFVQAYGRIEKGVLDASCLRIALVGFLPATDARIRGTVEAIEKEADAQWVGAAIQHAGDRGRVGGQRG